ncbi:MAG: hypothetical protein JNJ83_07290 [Verrucomicrobiaceae bacterium]|nr:hypothetical protein [Verrucomicrobiaceae bacterium]
MKSLKTMRIVLATIIVGIGIATSANAQFPTTAGNVGNFSGIIQGSTAGTDTQLNSAHATITVTTAGVFSGKLNRSGVVTTVAGTFNPTTGVFSTAAPVSGAGEAFNLTYSSAGTPSITGTITRYKAGAPVAVLNLSAIQTYSKVDLPPVGKTGIYNVALTAPVAPPSLAVGEYPTGNSVGTFTVKGTDGTAKAVIRLADGTVATSATWLRKNSTVGIYAPFAARLGALVGNATVDTSALNTDVTGTGLRWFRAPNNSHYYQAGYEEGLTVDLTGAFQSTSTLGSMNFTANSPNATLTVSSPLVAGSPVTKNMDVNGSGVGLTNPLTKDPKFTILPTTSTKSGQITGQYTDLSSGKHSIFGIVVAKGGVSNAYGFLLSPLPKNVDGTGKGGLVQIVALP